MAKKKTNNSKLGQLTIKDAKIGAIIRGMPFYSVISASFGQLQSYIDNNWNKPTNPHLLDEFDEWKIHKIEEEYASRGETPEKWVYHPQLRLGFIGEVDENGEIVSKKRVKGIKKPKKPKREKTSEGIFRGTKKALTFELAMRGYTKDATGRLVMDKFPDVSPKSISTWWSKARKAEGAKPINPELGKLEEELIKPKRLKKKKHGKAKEIKEGNKKGIKKKIRKTPYSLKKRKNRNK